MMPTTNVICIKWGNPFAPAEVNRLFQSARANTSRVLRFFCLTDDPIGLDPAIEVLSLSREPFEGAMDAVRHQTIKGGHKLRKIAMFRPDLIPDLDGPLLALDIDVAIVGALDPLMDAQPGMVCMARPFAPDAKVKTDGEGSVLRFDPNLHGFLYDRMAQDPAGMTIKAQGSEQTYTSMIAKEEGVLRHFADDWVVSFKHHCRPMRPLKLVMTPRKPAAAKVVCFHGKPSVEEAVNGYRAGPFKSTRPAKWLLG